MNKRECNSNHQLLRTAGPGAGGRGGRAHAQRHGVRGGLHSARGTAGSESQVTPLYSSSAKIDPQPGSNTVQTTALNASVNSVRESNCLSAGLLSCLLACLPTYLPSYLLTYMPTYPPICLTAYLPPSLPTYLLTYLFTYLATCKPTYPEKCYSGV